MPIGSGSWCLRRFLHGLPRLSDKAFLDSIRFFGQGRFIHTTSRLTDNAFLDSLQLCVQGGSGGKGKPGFAGQGGDGGSVIFKGTSKRILKGLQTSYEGKLIKADDGKNAEGPRVLGESARDRYIEVPVGVSVSTRKGRHLGDINAPGEFLCVARGAKGGGPLNGFKARHAQFQYINLDLKLVADVGLVGFPNAGKSTLLTHTLVKRPSKSCYPFTTLQPQLGVMSLEEEEQRSLVEGRSPRRVTIADMPGLIEGASKNVGLGHEFLKHIERTKVLLFVVDVHGFYLGTHSIPKDPFQSLCLLLSELRHYDESLLRRPALLCVNKVENDAAVAALRRLIAQLNDFRAALQAAFPSTEELEPLLTLPAPRFRDIHAISAEKRVNIKPVINNLYKMAIEQERLEAEEEEEEVDKDANANRHFR